MSNKLDWFVVIGIILVVSSLVSAVVIYFNYQKKECVSNPLVYAAKQYTQKYGYEFYGEGRLKLDPTFQSPIFFFNSTAINIENPTSSVNMAYDIPYFNTTDWNKYVAE